MLKSVEKTVYKYDMFNITEDVVASDVIVALSGGADSVALLYAMLELSPIAVKAAHLNHCLRAEESDADEQFCRALCEKLGVPLTVERIDVKSIAEKTGESIELCARNQRYAFLQRVAGRYGVIATAHTADDNLETVIFNLARGTGLSGLCGIPPVRERIIRPLIFCTRDQIEQYLAKKGQQYCTDSTNSDEQYTRNFIRHSIVPKLEQLNPSVKLGVAKTCEGIRNDNEFITDLAEELLEKGATVENLNSAHKSVTAVAVSLLCKRTLGTTPERKTVEAILLMLENGRGKLNFEGNCFAEIEKGELCFYKLGNIELSIPLANAMDKNIGDFEFSLISKEEFSENRNVNKKFSFIALDYDKIPKDAILHNNNSSGSIRIAGRNCSKSVGKLLNECKVPERKKGEILIISDSSGVLAVLPYAVSERVKIDSKTKSILLIKKNEE